MCMHVCACGHVYACLCACLCACLLFVCLSVSQTRLSVDLFTCLPFLCVLVN